LIQPAQFIEPRLGELGNVGAVGSTLVGQLAACANNGA
jgi:hypothetical protein